MNNPNHFLIGLFLSCFLFFSCGSENSEELNAPETQTFSDPIQVEFGFTSLRTAEGSTAASKGNVQSSKSQTTSLTTDAASILISINGSNGESIYENHKIDLVRVGDNILSLPMSFTATGTYYVTLFQVLDENNIALAMTPRENSVLASVVSTTLDHEFLIDIDNSNRVNLEVVLLNNNLEAADFGYSTFSFVEIDLNPFLIGVFTYDEITSNFELTASTVTVTHHESNHVVHNQPHDDSTITIYIPTYEDDELFTIEVGSPGFKTHTSSHTFAELLNHFDPVPQGAGPMIITLDAVETLISTSNLRLDFSLYPPIYGSAGIRGLDVSNDGQYVLVGTGAGTFRNNAYLYRITETNGTSSETLIGTTEGFRNVTLSPDGSHILTKGHSDTAIYKRNISPAFSLDQVSATVHTIQTGYTDPLARYSSDGRYFYLFEIISGVGYHRVYELTIPGDVEGGKTLHSSTPNPIAHFSYVNNGTAAYGIINNALNKWELTTPYDPNGGMQLLQTYPAFSTIDGDVQTAAYLWVSQDELTIFVAETVTTNPRVLQYTLIP